MELSIGVDAWIIQDGNYGDFTVGQSIQVALEFYCRSLKPSNRKTSDAINLRASLYQVCGRVLYRKEDVWVLDAGFLAYQQGQLPAFATEGSWIEGEIYLGIDPFMYFENLKNQFGMPALTYNLEVKRIFLETTPWLMKTDETGQTSMIRSAQNEGYREIVSTNAWHDDGGHAHYILECHSMDEHKPNSR